MIERIGVNICINTKRMIERILDTILTKPKNPPLWVNGVDFERYAERHHHWLKGVLILIPISSIYFQ